MSPPSLEYKLQMDWGYSKCQCDTLAPFLYIVFLECVPGNFLSELTINPRQSRRVPAAKFTDVNFADEYTLLSDTIQLSKPV